MAVPQSYPTVSDITQSDITVFVDYNDVNAVDPDPGVIFYGQVDVDRFLYERGATNFKHLMSLWEAFPSKIAHVITMNVAVGDHYPRAVDTTAAWYLSGKLFVGGKLILSGGLPSTYVSRDASLEDLVPVSTQVGSYDPYMAFSGTPFATFDLHGWFAVFDTGQVTIIHDHDDSTLYFIDELAPTPSSVTVARPSTRLLNDDGFGAKLAGTAIWGFHGARNTLGDEVEINDLCIAPYGGNAIRFIEMNSTASRVMLDNTVGPSEGGIGFFLGGHNSWNSFYCCSRITTLGLTTPYFPVYAGEYTHAVLEGVYFRGGSHGILFRYTRDNLLWTKGLILDNVGADTLPNQDKGSIVMNGGFLRCMHTGNGKRNEIRNGTTYGINLVNGGYVRGPSSKVFVFKNMSAPCVSVKNTGILDLTVGVSEFIDGGGNNDVGIQIDGPGAEVQVNAGSDVTGSVGDVRMSDGTILSYSYITSDGPVTDFFGNVVSVT